ncbi:Retrovirus-related Pol polyprotein from transposon TNT 1-94 [Durusdinium trenchii]|uniref:Retrovirus-related Pol polyprotein from transposon TNT 1-94 n=1 Tax=Durusdinium trenchii TaxID=1381693 RepID=A0ABP0PG08_9DINO
MKCMSKHRQFDTPPSAPPSTMPPLQRPAFLELEDGKGSRTRPGVKRESVLEPRYERSGDDEMKRQVHFLMMENKKLKEHVQSMLHKTQEEELYSQTMKQLWEENLKLRADLQRASLAGMKEEKALFATPNGSADQDPPSGRQHEGKDEKSKTLDAERGVLGVDEEEFTDATGRGRNKNKEDSQEGDGVTQQTLSVILKLVEGMQKIQDRMSKDQAMIQTKKWWSLTLEEARSWYQKHLLKSPLDRLTHQIAPSAKLTLRKWARLEKRATALLLSAVPESLREEVVSSKSLSTFGILVKGMIAYQPGGLSERQAILGQALQNPVEASNVGQGVTTFALRWKRRAEEVGVSIPDPTILARGLGKMMKKLVSMHPELHFRLQLIRSTLVDAVPTHD